MDKENRRPETMLPESQKILNIINDIRANLARKNFDGVADGLIQLYSYLNRKFDVLYELLNKLPLEVLKKYEELSSLLERIEKVPVTLVDFVLPSQDLAAEVETKEDEDTEKITKVRNAEYSRQITRLRKRFFDTLKKIADNYNSTRGSKGIWILKQGIDKKVLRDTQDELNSILQEMYKIVKEQYIAVNAKVLEKLLKEKTIDEETYKLALNELPRVADRELSIKYVIRLIDTTMSARELYLDRLKSFLGSYVTKGVTSPFFILLSDLVNSEQLKELAEESLADFIKDNPSRQKELAEFLSQAGDGIIATVNY
ncbi:hypothetical protein DJ532_14470, partial [Sulfolobus sp. A20-N-F8]